MRVLITGGAGYIGSHVAIDLLRAGHDVSVIDNLSNSTAEGVRCVEELAGRSVDFHEVDCCDTAAVDEVFGASRVDAVMHLAGLKWIDESARQPLAYYRTNIDSTLTVLEAMDRWDVRRLVFSSSASVYGRAGALPTTEHSPTGNGLTTPYARSKAMIEDVLRDCATAQPLLEIVLLRYFNPIGADPSGLIGENPRKDVSNLVSVVAEVATGTRQHVEIFGGDHDTPDGSAVRDFVHVCDLASGHRAAVETAERGVAAVNLGTGAGTSVREVIAMYEMVSGRSIPFVVTARRDGDVSASVAEVTRAAEVLSWRARRTVRDALEDDWRWRLSHPAGHASP